jgi:hypothetical protein
MHVVVFIALYPCSLLSLLACISSLSGPPNTSVLPRSEPGRLLLSKLVWAVAVFSLDLTSARKS